MTHVQRSILICMFACEGVYVCGQHTSHKKIIFIMARFTSSFRFLLFFFSMFRRLHYRPIVYSSSTKRVCSANGPYNFVRNILSTALGTREKEEERKVEKKEAAVGWGKKEKKLEKFSARMYFAFKMIQGLFGIPIINDVITIHGTPNILYVHTYIGL